MKRGLKLWTRICLLLYGGACLLYGAAFGCATSYLHQHDDTIKVNSISAESDQIIIQHFERGKSGLACRKFYIPYLTIMVENNDYPISPESNGCIEVSWILPCNEQDKALRLLLEEPYASNVEKLKIRTHEQQSDRIHSGSRHRTDIYFFMKYPLDVDFDQARHEWLVKRIYQDWIPNYYYFDSWEKEPVPAGQGVVHVPNLSTRGSAPWTQVAFFAPFDCLYEKDHETKHFTDVIEFDYRYEHIVYREPRKYSTPARLFLTPATLAFDIATAPVQLVYIFRYPMLFYALKVVGDLYRICSPTSES